MKTYLQKHWEYLLAALVFFTRLPIKLKSFEEGNLAHIATFLPLIGILIGCAGALVFLLASQMLPVSISILLSICSTILLTGAIHEDGLADSADGLGGGHSKESSLNIMSDSRIGTYGVVAITMCLLGKYQSLSNVRLDLVPIAMIAGHSISRLSAVLIMSNNQYAKTEGKSKSAANKLRNFELIIAILFGIAPLFLMERKLWISLIPVAIVYFWFQSIIRRKLDGYTGDCLGAVQQLTEVTFYIALLASINVFH